MSDGHATDKSQRPNNDSASGEGSNNGLYEDDVERQWGEAASIHGIDPDLLHARSRRYVAPARSASFSPILIGYAAIMAGPLIAALLTLFTDGDPPKGRHAVAALGLGATAWVVNTGLALMAQPLISAQIDAALQLGVLFLSGALLWALYRYWMQGSRHLDRQSLIHSALLFVGLSLIFWMGRDATWMMWLGR